MTESQRVCQLQRHLHEARSSMSEQRQLNADALDALKLEITLQQHSVQVSMLDACQTNENSSSGSLSSSRCAQVPRPYRLL